MWKILCLTVCVILYVVEGCTYKGAECPVYTVVEKHSDYEIRNYNPITWATTTEISNIRRIGQYKTFMRLFRYISGQNDQQQKMAMTAPVRMKNTETENGTIFEMSFVLPEEFAGDPPAPKDERITIDMGDQAYYAVRTFKGYVWRQQTWVDEAQKLAESVKGDESVDNTVYYQVGYDAPFDLFDRRNEIWMVKKVNQETNEIYK